MTSLLPQVKENEKIEKTIEPKIDIIIEDNVEVDKNSNIIKSDSSNTEEDVTNLVSKSKLSDKSYEKENSIKSKVNEKNKKNDKIDKKIFYIEKILDRQKQKILETKKKKRGYRGSKYRGVTKNGKSWQVLIMINRNKKYFGNFKSEADAAHAYDRLAMKYHGEKARLNFYHQGFIKYVNEP